MRGLPRLRHGRGRRGATLLVTVLVATVAASIVVVLVQLALFSLSGDVRSAAYESADGQLQSMRQEVATVLAQDPLAVYSQVLDWELPRVCLPRSTRVEADSVISPGEPWPAECGFSWGYEAQSAQSAQAGSGVLLSPPAPGSPFFEVLAVSRSGEVSVAVRDFYALGGQVRPRAYSSSPLSLSALRTESVNVPIYSYGQAAVDVEDLALGALVASEKQLSLLPVFNAAASSVDGALLAGPTASAGPPAILPVRDIYPQPMPLGLLRSSFSALAGLGCPAVSAEHPPVNGLPAWSSALCLEPGGWVTPLSLDAGAWRGSTFDTPVQVPTAAQAFLILPADAPAGAVRVLYSTSLPSVPALGTPVSPLHPASELFWTELGTFFVPASGVLFSSLDTYVGLCGASFAVGPCTSRGTGVGSSVFSVNFLLVAGSPSDPADVVLAGPIEASAEGRVGVLASGSVLVPFFASPPLDDLTLDVDIAVLGVNVSDDLFRSIPASPVGVQGDLNLTGLRLGRNLSADPGVFGSLSWVLPQSLDGSSPWLPSPELRFEKVGSERVPPASADSALLGRVGPG